ncbi:MAG: hypothetical protein IT355_14710 [Gemmatimonadaceae bacterium]|nr:hypothetical protein [Gemmatimonadaceae bacterium]
MRSLLLAALLAVVPGAPLCAQDITLPAGDRVRLAEAFRLVRSIGDSAWRGWGTAPFAVLLLTPDAEFLLHHPAPTPDFVRAGFDSVLGTEVYRRAPTLPPTLLATFPAVGGVNTVVVGGAGPTGRRSTQWVLTVMHEHFHQLQMSHPSYQPALRAIDLARGDETGQWMLSFPFPYQAPQVRTRFAAFTAALLAAAFAPPPTGTASPVPAAALGQVIATRTALKAALTPADYRYLGFQMWQEGVARYIELRVARLASRLAEPSAAMRALPDFTSYADEADALEHEIRTAATVLPMAVARRVAFYPVGAAYAMLLDRVRPAWATDYFSGALTLDGALLQAPVAPRKARRHARVR